MFTPSGQLFRVDQVPEHFKEVFILSGYRNPQSSAKQCVLSIFEANNETFNFWTHFLPSLFYAWMTFRLSTELDFAENPSTWPMLAYMISLCLFPLVSAVAHIFNTMSIHARHICFFVDYGALSLYSLGVAIAYKAYIFPPDLIGTGFYDVFITIATINAIACIAFACETRFMQHGLMKKAFRVLAFGVPYMFDSIPVIFRIVFSQASHEDEALLLHQRQFLMASLSAFLYMSHIPERLCPGRFDIIGHSHQLFHVCSILGSYTQMMALLTDFQQIDATQGSEALVARPRGDTPTFSSTLGLLLVVMVINFCIILFFIIKLYRRVPCLNLELTLHVNGTNSASKITKEHAD